MNNQIQTPMTAFDRYVAVMKKTMGGIPMLILTIAFSLITILQIVFSFSLLEGEIGLVFTIASLIPIAMYILTTVGLWVTWAGAKSKTKEFVGGLSG